tara:strand:- start:19816 stop:20844 length:1029 start_codon:yes stop_codon:yes gene_type:complete
MIPALEKFIIYPENKLIDCLKKIDSNGFGELLVVNSKFKLLGSISDGDIRRSLLLKKSLTDNIKNIFNKKPVFLTNIKNIFKARSLLINNNINLLPVVNSHMQIIKVLSIRDFNLTNKNNNSVVIMAGGQGLRMKPFTNIFPKALLPFKNSTIIEVIIDKFMSENFNTIVIPTGFKSNVLIKHIKNEGYKNIKFSKELKPLGTIGGLKLVEKELSRSFFLTNCDTYINANFTDLLNFHERNKNEITITCAIQEQKLEFGVCDLDKHKNLKKIIEKPTYKRLVNTGLYVLNKNILKYVPKNKYFNTTDLINKCLTNKKKVGIYPITFDDWKDVGNWGDYKKNL